MDSAFRAAIEEARFRLRMNAQQFGIYALEQAVTKAGLTPPPTATYTPPASRTERQLSEILQSGDNEAIGTVKTLIEAFHGRLRPASVEVVLEVEPDAPASKSVPLRHPRAAQR